MLVGEKIKTSHRQIYGPIFNGGRKFKNWIVLTEKNNDEEQTNQKKTDNAHSPESKKKRLKTPWEGE